MALTKNDQRIIAGLFTELFNKSFLELISPPLNELINWKMDMNDWKKEIDKNLRDLKSDVSDLKIDVKGLHKRFDTLVEDTHKTLNEQDSLLGGYTYDFVSTKQFTGLEKRVEKLELAKV